MNASLKNTFKNNQEPKRTLKVVESKPGAFTPTDKKVMGATIGRDASEFLKRKQPVFPPELVEFHNPGIKWLSLKRLTR